MPIISLLIAAVFVVVGITLIFLFATKKAYSIEHKVDPVPLENKEPSDFK